MQRRVVKFVLTRMLIEFRMGAVSMQSFAGPPCRADYPYNFKLRRTRMPSRLLCQASLHHSSFHAFGIYPHHVAPGAFASTFAQPLARFPVASGPPA